VCIAMPILFLKMNAELPGTSVAFLDRYGTRLAGRAAGLTDGGPGAGAGGERVLVDMDLPDGLGRLVASGAVRSPGWPSVVRTVLGLAVAALSAWAAGERLVAGREFAVQEALAERLLAMPEALLDGVPEESSVPEESVSETDAASGAAGDVREALGRAAALGWAVRGPVSGFVVRPVGWQAEPAEHALVRELLVGALGVVPVMRRGEGWAGWAELGPEALAVRLQECARLLPRAVAAGAGRQVERLGAVGESLLGAEAAAFTARAGAVARADRMGPAELLAALPAGVLRAPAEVVLGPLRAADKDGSLLATLAAVLDGGGALRAAERLGVHRNTVTTRLERVRAAGYDLEDPATRLALHLAVHVSR
ncbi:helix-turn-helix domain-containing protein, partial [Nonomuraea sp. NPDC055795]